MTALAASLCVLAGCAPSPAELAAQAAAQRAGDQNRCMGFGFQPGTDGFAHCMMTVATERDAQAAADRRAEAARQADAQRDRDARKAAADAASQDAWDRKTGQGIYATSSRPPQPPPTPSPASAPSTTPSSNPVDAVRDSIQKDLDKMQNAGTLSQ
ncbi:hypothetical protein [Acidisphaera rubrifaciens]|uniref:hypothetical protein n=1 Tax=Acidisphaera rubrifaciens TaxID=50715 RepID=UPI0019D6C66C|nr:hypothetical protein [Acidisphaera rubrifaciens]